MKDELECGIVIQIEPAVRIRYSPPLGKLPSPQVCIDSYFVTHISLSHSGCAVEDYVMLYVPQFCRWIIMSLAGFASTS